MNFTKLNNLNETLAQAYENKHRELLNICKQIQENYPELGIAVVNTLFSDIEISYTRITVKTTKVLQLTTPDKLTKDLEKFMEQVRG